MKTVGKMTNKYDSAMRFSIVAERDETYRTSDSVASSIDAERVARNIFQQTDIYEEMYILLLNRANKVIGHARISQGGTTGTVCDPKLIAFYAINSLASGVIMVHNHPSGNPQPSGPDIQITKKVRDALQLLDVNLLDHLILTHDRCLSMQDECLM